MVGKFYLIQKGQMGFSIFYLSKPKLGQNQNLKKSDIATKSLNLLDFMLFMKKHFNTTMVYRTAQDEFSNLQLSFELGNDKI